MKAVLVLCTAAVALTFAGTATANDFTGHHQQVFRVVVVPGLTIGDLPQLATEGAVGLLVPNAGPRTSQGAAFAIRVRKKAARQARAIQAAAAPHPPVLHKD